GRKAVVPAEVVQVQARLLFEKGQLRAEPEAAGSYARMLRLAGSLRLCDRRVQSSSCRTSFAEQRTRQSLAADLMNRLRVAGWDSRVEEITAWLVATPGGNEPHARPSFSRPANCSRHGGFPPVPLAGDNSRRPTASRDEDDRSAVARVRPFGEKRSAVRR